MLNKLTKLSSEEVQEIKNIFPHIPEEYFDVMRTTGWGSVRNNLMLYCAPVTPDEIYGEDYPGSIGNIIIFGDDFNGYCFGWDTNNKFSIVEIDPIDFSCEELKLNFKDFVLGK